MQNVTISPESFILAMDNDGENYQMFLQACGERFISGKWHIARIIVRTKLLFMNNVEIDETVVVPSETLNVARKHLDYRYHKHYVLEILPEYVERAKREALKA